MRQEYSSNPKLRSSRARKKKPVKPALSVSVLSGGNSSERKISLRSGRAVYKALRTAGYKVSFLDPRNWKKILPRLKRSDAVFLALHGRGGEDGTMQKKLERLGVPYIGSDARSSLRAFDKLTSKQIFTRRGIPTPEYVLVPSKNWERKLTKLTLPLFVKPVEEGSSIGVFEIEDFSHAAEKLRRSMKQFGRLLVEEKVVGREFTVGVLGEKPLPVIELCPKRSFYDYRAKYTKGMTEYKVPARIPKNLAEKLQRTAVAVHKVLGLRDISRIDMMVDRSGNPYVLEANSIPGFTELSLLPKAARAAGIPFDVLCSELVCRAIRRKEREYGKKEA